MKSTISHCHYFSPAVKWGQPISSHSPNRSVFGRCLLLAWLPSLSAFKCWSEARLPLSWYGENELEDMWSLSCCVCVFNSARSVCVTLLLFHATVISLLTQKTCVNTHFMSCLNYVFDWVWQSLQLVDVPPCGVSEPFCVCACACARVCWVCVCVRVCTVCVCRVCGSHHGCPSLSWLGVINLWAMASKGDSDKTSCFLQLSS